MPTNNHQSKAHHAAAPYPVTAHPLAARPAAHHPGMPDFPPKAKLAQSTAQAIPSEKVYSQNPAVMWQSAPKVTQPQDEACCGCLCTIL